MFGFSLSHFIVLGLVVLLFGPEKVGTMAKGLARFMNEIRRSLGN